MFEFLVARDYVIFQKWTVFIQNLIKLTLQIIFDASWASMNIGSKCSLAWNSLKHPPSWWFYLHSRIEETSSPGIICILCPQVLRQPSDHGTSSMRKHLLAKAHITRVNKLTESEVTVSTSSTVDDTALPLLQSCVSNGSGPPSSVRVRVATKLLQNWWSGWSTNQNRQFGYGSMINSKPSEWGGLSAGRPVSLSIASFKALDLAVW